MNIQLYNGDCLEEMKKMPDESVDCVITSPPYWGLRDYGSEGQLGLEKTFVKYITKLCDIFDEVRRILKDEGTCWVNIGDTYGTQSGAMRDGKFGLKNTNNQQFIQPKSLHKCLLQIPSRFAVEMIERGWILRNEIIWHKPNAMPQSVKDRFTHDFEKVFFFVKHKQYSFAQQLEPFSMNTDVEYRRALRRKNAEKYNMKKPYANNFPKKFGNTAGRNKRSVWSIATKPSKEAHIAMFPEELVETPIRSGCPEGGVVMDPFMGSGTTGIVAKRLGRDFVGIEINSEYYEMAKKRVEETPIQDTLLD